MPYSGASDKDLPAAVKKMSAKARKIYASTFNAVYKRNGNKDEGKAGNAFAIALRAAQNWVKKHGDKSAEEVGFTEGEVTDRAFFGPLALEKLQKEMPDWIPVHMVGEWNDPRYGDFSMTLTKMENAIASFYSCAHRPNAPVDAQVPIDTRHSGDGAGGWLDAMTIHGEYLLGKPAWTPKGEEIVGNKLFRFISPLYTEVGDDVLIKEVTLTNRAFLDMPPVGVPIMLSADVDDPIILRAINQGRSTEDITQEPLETSKQKKQEEAKMPEENDKVLDQEKELEEEKPKKLETPAVEDKALANEQLGERIKQLEATLGTLTTDNKDKTDRLMALEHERHDLLVGKHIKAAEVRGVAPVIVRLVEPVMAACHEDAERIISLEAVGEGEPTKANIFEAMVRLLEQCPVKLGTLTTGPQGERLADATLSQEDQTVDAHLKALAEGEKSAREFAKTMGWDVIPEDDAS